MSAGILAALAAGLFLLAALWVPINPEPVPEGYYRTSWLEAFQPRGLAGTVAAVLDLSPRGFVRMNMIGQLAFLFLLLGALGRSGAPRRAYMVLPLLASLLAFNQLIFFGNFLSGGVDVHSAVLTLGAVHLLVFGERAPRGTAIAAAALLSSLSLLNHEKSLLDAAILGLWLWAVYGIRPALGYLLPVLATLVAVVAPSTGEARMGLSIPEYWAILGRSVVFVREESGNVIGILYAGGFAWLLWVYGAVGFVRSRSRGGASSRLRAVVFVTSSILLCLAPLLVAHDTSRLVGLMWLPTLLVLSAAGFAVRVGRSRATLATVAVLVLLQLALPPVFVFRQGAIPLNCYAQKAVRALCTGEPQEEWVAWNGWLRLYEDGGHRPWYQRRCLPVHPFRR